MRQMPSKASKQRSASALSPEREHNGLERARIADIQRARMLAAMTQAASELGAVNVTVAHVVARSGVSRRTFYELFEDREDCFMAAFEDSLARASAYVSPADAVEGRWRERVREALAALLRFLDEEPCRARLLVVETLGAGQLALRRRQQVLALLVEAVDEGRSVSRAGSEPPPLAAEGVVGAVLAIVHARMLERESEPLVGLLNQLMAMIVLPYAGAAAARRELARPASKAKPSPSPHRTAQNALSDLEMRITYRTVRVLIAIAQSPGASNRKIAETAGVSDPGQISKLLRRLYRLGLIEKAPGERIRGEPNAWRLTTKGQDIERMVATQATPS